MGGTSNKGGKRRLSFAVGASDEEMARNVRETLERYGHQVAISSSPEALLSGFDPGATDLVLLAFDGMEAAGFGLCRELRDRSEADPVAILVALSSGSDDAVSGALGAGADDWIPLPIDWPLLRHRIMVLLRSNNRLVQLREKLGRLEDAQRIGRVGSWEIDAATHEMVGSEQTFHILGLAPTDDHPKLDSFLTCVHPDEHDAVMSQLAAAAHSSAAIDLSYRLVDPNGAIRHVQLRGESIGGPDSRRLQGTIQDVTEQSRMQEEIKHLAHYDSLTGLSNRRRFREQLERSIERARVKGHLMAVLYMDLDQFKRINDTLGHSAGDHLLKHVAEVLFHRVRTTDIIARNVDDGTEVEVSRLGGDEFAVVLSEIGSPEDARHVAERILGAVTTPISFEEHQISATTSIGISIYPNDGENAETLIKHADTAMYKAKERGRNIYEFFSHKMNEGILRKVALETKLRDALKDGELRLVYQPRVDLKQRKVTGFEALLRWQAPELGPVMPKEFIPVAEDTGLIVSIGEWVLETACAHAKTLRVEGYGKVRMSVNVSSRQFVHHDLRATVVNALTKTGLDPHQLELEITESVLLEDDPKTSEMLREIKDMGVKLALDDFGTGYSSISCLTRLPLDTLKLDISIVRDVGTDPAAQGIARALISMAHAVKLNVTAEGVDHTDQARFLNDEGCDELQGFLISAAVPPEECKNFFEPPDGGISAAEWKAILGSDAASGVT